MITVTSTIELDERELDFQFSRSSGPGGQNVNKVETAVQLRFDVAGSASLPEPVKQRLLKFAGNRVTKDGLLLIESRQSRSQSENKEAALEQLVSLIRRASRKPRVRKKTKPSEAARRRRLEQKRQRSHIKKLRQRVQRDAES